MKTSFSRNRVLALLCALVMLVSMLPVVAGADTIMYCKTSTGESVNVHSTRDAVSTNVVGHVPYSGKVTVISNDGKWSYISYKKVNGYMLSSFLVNSEPIKKGVTSPGKTSTMYAKTSNKGDLNMRSSMTTKYSWNIVGHVPYGKAVTVLSTHGSWAYIKYNGVKGYVLKGLLSSSKPTASGTSATISSKGSTRYVTTTNGKGVNFRSSAAKKGTNIIKVLPKGTKVTAYGTTGSWTRVKYGNRYGYIQSSFLTTKKP